MFPSDFQLSLPLLTPYSVENVASEELDAGDLKVSILEPSAAIISIRHLPAYPVYFSPPVQGATANTARARERNEFTDFVLTYGPERFPVHRVIICSQSKVLHAACSKPFQVSKTLERASHQTHQHHRRRRHRGNTGFLSNLRRWYGG